MPAEMEMTPASVAPTIHFKIRQSESILLNRFSYPAMALAASPALSCETPACSWLFTHLLTFAYLDQL